MYWFPLKKLKRLEIEVKHVTNPGNHDSKGCVFCFRNWEFSPLLVNSELGYIYGTHDLSRFFELSLKRVSTPFPQPRTRFFQDR